VDKARMGPHASLQTSLMRRLVVAHFPEIQIDQVH
jgi:hypothetical protein